MNKKSGITLVVVLWVVVLLTTIIVSLLKGSMLNSRVVLSRAERIRCVWAARAGVETAIAVLNEDETDSDGLTDAWADNVEDFNDVEIEGCFFTVEVFDECGKLNVNTASKKQLLELPDMTDEIADSLIDWRDKDSKISAEGAEQGYYDSQGFPYQIRNAKLRTLREALLVKGLDKEVLFGEDVDFDGVLDSNEDDGEERWPIDDSDGVLDYGLAKYVTCCSFEKNVDKAGNDRVNIKSEDEKKLAENLGITKGQAKWIKQKTSEKNFKGIGDLIDDKSPKKANANAGKKSKDKAEPLDIETFKRIVDKITVVDDDEIFGKVNINTAGKEVLTALLEGDEIVADEIVKSRDSREEPFASIADLLDVKGVDVKSFKKIADFICVRSSVFMVRCVARSQANNAAYKVEAIVKRDDSACEVIYWYEGACN